jgi:catechol 2,3-dioxygenase
LEEEPLQAHQDIDEKPVLHHVTLKTVRVAEMVAWYETVVGCVPNFRFEGGAWTSNDEANHRIAFLQTPALSDDPEKLTHTGMHHMAFEFSSLESLLNNYARLAEIGILPHVCLDHGMTTSFYYVDPDGNSVELQSDNFGDWKQSSKWMRTSPDFARNPIGVEVDPPRLAAALAAGVPLDEVHRRSRAGEYQPAAPGDLRLPA